MADEVTTTSTTTDTLATTDTPAAAPAPAAKKDTAVDHVATVNKALDAARDAMIASGMTAGDADAFLNAARPSGTSTAVGNLADLNRSSGLPAVQAPTVPSIEQDRLAFASKPPNEEAPA